MLNVLLAVFVVLLVYFWVCKTSKPKRFPPGPRRYPVIGSVLDMVPPNAIKPELFFGVRHFREKYGSIIGFYLGNERAVVLTNYEDIKEVLSKAETAHRPPIIGLSGRPGKHSAQEVDPELNQDNPPGVILSNGRYWKEQRRFMLRNLRDFGFGKSAMEDTIHDDVKMLIDHLSSRTGHAIQIGNTLNIAIVNSLWNIVVGEKLTFDDPKLDMVVRATNELLSSDGPTGVIASLLPHKSMIYWPFFKQVSGYASIERIFKKLADFMQPYVESHKANLKESNDDCYIDVMLKEIQNTKDVTSSFYGQRGEYALVNNIMDLFMAGMETTSSALLWSFLYLLHYPECQSKIQAELDGAIGRQRLPTFDDRPTLHYTNAFLQESMRLTAFIPLSVFHYTSTDVALRGFVIPKRTMILPSLYHVMYNPEHFPEPDVFNPDRFLDDQGKFLVDERVIPFGIGKRICLGKSLAEKELFLFFTGIIQNFNVRNAPGADPPAFGIDDSPVPGIVRSVPEFDLVLENR